MKFIISGTTVLGEAQKGVFGSIIKVFDADPSSSDAKLIASQITNRNGEFSFRLRGQIIEEYVKNKKPVYVQAFDKKTQTLSVPTPVAVVSGQVQRVNLVVKPESIANADIPPQPKAERIVLKAVFDTIDLAIKTSVETRIDNARLVARRYYCTLPPIINLEDILDVAMGVFRGRPEDMKNFEAYLDNMEVWNHRSNPIARRQLNAEQAVHLLSEDFLKGLNKKMKAAGRQRPGGGVVPIQSGITLLIAAMRIAANNPVQLHHNVGVVIEQLGGLRGLNLLHKAALGALTGTPAERTFFVNTLDLIGGFCEPGGLPIPATPQPSPIPWGNPFWPPDPEESGLPIDPGIIDDCTPDAVRGFREAMERTVVYTIDNISPINACTGQEILIRGSNFEFEGSLAAVLFPGFPHGTKIPATPISYSGNEIRVVIPEGATCGDLELEIPGGAATILVCEATIELFHGPSVPFRFNGGSTIIGFFSTTAIGDCLNAGDEVTFLWSTCNADRIRLDISSVDGISLFSNIVEGVNFLFSIPVLERDTRVTATLVAQGPCGVDEEQIQFSIHRGTPFRLDELISFTSGQFFNWHGNHVRGSVSVITPANLNQLVSAVQSVEFLRQRVGARGSAWSYTDCIVPRRTTNFLVDTSSLAIELTNVLLPALRTSLRSVLEPAVERELRIGIPVTDRLIHVEAGIKIHALNCLLDGKSLALPTMGGDMGQSIAGAINTGTHGANAKLPPIADFVRAIHLVGPGGQEWWIEPATNPVTEREKMETLKNDSILNPCLKVVYDDLTFHSCLVSVGSAGIVYSYVIEAVNAHNLISTTIGMTWGEAKEKIQRQIVEPSGLPEPWFFEVTVNPTRHARLTTRSITSDPVPTTIDPVTPSSSTSGPDPFDVALLSFLFGPGVVASLPVIIGFGTGAVAALIGALPAYIARRTAEMIRYFTNPFEWYRIVEIQDEIELIGRLIDTVTSLIRTIALGARDTDLAKVIPKLLNVIWQVGFYMVDGRSIVDTAQNIFTSVESRPEGTTIKKSYVAMTGQTDCSISIAPPTPVLGLLPPAHHSAFVRLIESFEYALPAERIIEFVDDLLGLADRVRGTNDAVIVILNLRFTQQTRALIGMQQFARTGHVEVYTVSGMAGNEIFHRNLLTLATEYGAIPHWGQFHDETSNFESLFGSSLRNWQSVVDHIAREGRGQLNTFRHHFVLSRRLLTEL